MLTADVSLVTEDHVLHFSQYAEFFSDFCLQENDLLQCDPFILSCAILAFTRKHINVETIWSQDIATLTFCTFDQIQQTLQIIEEKYRETFPDHVALQASQVGDRQRLTNRVELSAMSRDRVFSTVKKSSLASATTQSNSQQSATTRNTTTTSKAQMFETQKKQGDNSVVEDDVDPRDSVKINM